MLVKKTKNSRENVTKTAGRVERNHDRTAVGRYNTYVQRDTKHGLDKWTKTSERKRFYKYILRTKF
jgi:hypothetical protein